MQAARNFLIQITLLHSTKPVVSRLLSIPPSVTFSQLHWAIAASFNYKAEDIQDGDYIIPCFYVFEASQNHKPHGLRENTLSLWPCGDNYGEDGEAGEVLDAHSTEVIKVFDGQEGFRYCEKRFRYTFHETDHIEHSLQILGRAAENTKGKIVCVAGLGSTALADWKQMTDGKPQRGPSTWKLDLGEVNLRLAELQKGWSYADSARL